jgi:hypothetical protein
MRNWLHFCNFTVRETKKGIYFDGHEREDVVQVILIGMNIGSQSQHYLNNTFETVTAQL